MRRSSSGRKRMVVEEFDDWYENIMKLSLYDTGVTAEFGDEFITLSCCSYHTEDGRFVVVGKELSDESRSMEPALSCFYTKIDIRLSVC